MMLQWLEEPATIEAARRIERAVAGVLADPKLRTPDLGGRLTTQEMGEAVVERL
jgi:isocitrate/isopropylmalate dehydrogenase